MEIIGKACRQMNPSPVISSTGLSGRVEKKIKIRPQLSKKSAREELEAAQSTCYKNENSAFSPQRLESTMKILGEFRNPATNHATVFSSTGGLRLGKEDKNNDKEENVEHKVEKEDDYDKQVKEVCEDKQVNRTR